MAVWIGVRFSGGNRSIWLIVELQGIRAQREEEKEKDGSARTAHTPVSQPLTFCSHLTRQATTARLQEVGTWTMDWFSGIRNQAGWRCSDASALRLCLKPKEINAQVDVSKFTFLLICLGKPSADTDCLLHARVMQLGMMCVLSGVTHRDHSTSSSCVRIFTFNLYHFGCARLAWAHSTNSLLTARLFLHF